MRPLLPICLVAFSLAAPLLAADAFPDAEISNGLVKARLYLPDPDKGYYRATRFDWSGQIPSLEYRGHSYFGEWNPAPYDPKLHDAITGPVEEFLTNGMGLGYAEAKAGGTFVKIGVGVIRKPEEPRFQQFRTYEIVDPGKWTVRKDPAAVTFTQTVTDPASGYAYVYTKTVRLAAGKPVLTLEHSLRNTGGKAIESDVYEHNFYMLDRRPTGPDIRVRFPFPVTATGNFQGAAETRGSDLVYLKELQNRQSAQSELTGFGSDPKDYNITVEDVKTGVGVRQTSDRPIARINFWSIRTTVCPEAYIHMNIEPGKEFTWKIEYEFYAPVERAAGSTKINTKDGLTYVWIPAGRFQMGCSPGDGECGDDERPSHEVVLTKGFWLGQTSVTQRAYERVTGKNPASHKGADFPVEEVNWDEARAYCEAIGGRLPTEAEYEYAARAGSTSARYGNLDEIAWYKDNSEGASHEVARKKPNAFGLFDMLGNTWQWVADWYGKYSPEPQVDPAGPASGDLKEPKGGSWGTVAKSLRASHRDTVEPGHRGNKLGMRCVSD